MTLPKVRFLRPNKVLGAQKNFLGPPKTQKIDFLKKPELWLIWLNIGGGSHNGPGHLGTLRPQYLIQKVATLL